MTQFKGTPGEWSVAYLDDNGQAVVKGEHTEVATCWHHCVGSIEKEMHANARLIASAPELLEALQDTLWEYVQLAGCGDCGNWDPEEESHVIKARGILAKALGGDV